MPTTEKLKKLVIRVEQAKVNAQEKTRLAREAEKLQRNAWEICQDLEKEIYKEITETSIPRIEGNCVVRVGTEIYLISVCGLDSATVSKITIQE